jgi:anti-sigma regulatory factor (Ser/Thr protein kinase)
MHEFPHDSQSIPRAREVAKRCLDGEDAETVEIVTLLVSEIVTNAIRYTAADFTVTIEHDEQRIEVQVTDQGGGTPSPRRPDPSDPTGRGLMIVQALSDEWGVTRHPDGSKAVWFRISRTRQ